MPGGKHGLVLHPHQDNVYAGTDDQVDYLIDMFMAIIQEEGRYHKAFGDPIWIGAPDQGFVATTTTMTGEDCLFSRL